ncbi:ABC transporter ATP-binding protein [Halobaculum sp. MBLA0143]|uniref:ABC transporter ATP-binding protein n=1 Tax=Halobaculum sp. MBLA0143 TaxID=3079933 RepID=UPI003523A1AB
MSDPATVTLSGVRKAYGDTVALDDVDVEIGAGEFFTLVGPSGCGKTTTLRTIAGFERPTRGTVRIDGRDVTGVPPEARGVGVVFQHYALFPHMSVAENVGYGLRFTDPPGGVSTTERVTELLELVGLPDAGDREPESLSGGQRQRVALARALAPGPRLLLLDEPLSALDARLRERLRRTVRRIQRELGITTVYVTHDQAEALAISDRVAVVSDGAIEQVAPPRRLYRRPATRFVAEFVGDNNVFTGRVTESDDDTATVAVADTEFLIADEGLRTDDRVTFCVRPEGLAADAAHNRIRATVRETEFLGETTRVRADWGDRTITLRVSEPPAVDTTVTVGFPPSAAHVVSDGA